MARTLFGTDGVRGPAGTFLTAELTMAVARAATAGARGGGDPTGRPRVLVVRDTRESGEMLESAFAAGVAAAGGDAYLAGVLPTPAAPLLIERHGFALAAVLSASHNPYGDNGIKLFGADGLKLTDDAELAIEAALTASPAPSADLGRVRALRGGLEDYLRALDERFGDLDLTGRTIVLDCAHGATAEAGPEAFRRRGAEPVVLAASPDGRNINDGVGSTHVGHLADAVREHGADLGFAFDGDGDRVLAVDRTGTVVDGDELIALAATHLRARDRLPGGGVAVTVMTNFGFHTAMRAAGIEVEITPVGDRYVLEALRRRGFALGGEQSGHIIDMGFAPSGDGIAAALLTLEALGDGDLAARGAMEKLPQTLVNVRVAERVDVERLPGLQTAIAEESGALTGRGRVLVRASGTEPLVRVMVEAPSADEAHDVSARLVAAVEAEVGTGAAR